ncbi:MAG: winged helix-turn-helix transcriptional regulator [Candidatus Helarchaeota archaeon]|nr:winged helix-turn-helix transcriptional regulator [Candidatus Helarchaeota archaeon]
MSFQGGAKKKGEGKELTMLHENILRVAQVLRKKRRFFNMEALLEECCNALPNPQTEIDLAIHDLLHMKQFVEGSQLIKEDVLRNEKRNRILEYVTKYPGAHKREIRKAFGLGAYITHRHLGFLVKFGFLRKSTFQNKSVFFPIDFDETVEAKTLLLRNDTAKTIYQAIQERGQLRLSEISQIVRVPYTTIRSHLTRLIEGGLIKRIREENRVLYVKKTEI